MPASDDLRYLASDDLRYLPHMNEYEHLFARFPSSSNNELPPNSDRRYIVDLHSLANIERFANVRESSVITCLWDPQRKLSRIACSLVLHRLLSSSDLSDVVLKCEGREWKLHKLMLVTRSKWFEKALCGDFKEAQNNEVILEEQDPEIVNLMVHWIYTGTLLPSVFGNMETAYEACVQLAHCADFFLLGVLRRECLTVLKKHLLEDAIWVQREFNKPQGPLNKIQVVPKHLDGLMKGVARAYELDMDEAKKIFLHFLKQAHYWMMSDDTFTKAASMIPEFWHDALQEQQKAIAKRRFWPYDAPLECHRCKGGFPHGADKPSDFWWVAIEYCPKIGLKATCNGCSSGFVDIRWYTGWGLAEYDEEGNQVSEAN
ncbi:BTB/POZ protein [Xylariaceae sp. FL0804]|nr:BTB/POZ protein [Xylariaceae sp. FL0804]